MTIRSIIVVVYTTSQGLFIQQERKTFENEQRNRDDAAKKRAKTSGVGESNNYYEDIYNIPPYNNTH